MAFLNGIFGGNTAGQQAGQQANQDAWQAAGLANNQYTAGENAALGQYGTNYFNPYTLTGNAANAMYGNALGLNGPGGNAAANAAFQASPGYQFQLGQGIQALDRSAAGSGMFGSGNAAMALNNYGQGVANQQYGNWLSNLSALNNQGLQAAFGQTGRQGSLAGINEWGAGGRAQDIYGAGLFGANALMQGQMSDAASNAQGGANLLGALLGGGNLAGKFWGGGAFAPSQISSDRRMKTDIELLGKDRDTGLNMYAYRYKSDPKTYSKSVGPMAQEIEKKRPDLVREIGGRKVISGNWLAEMSKAA